MNNSRSPRGTARALLRWSRPAFTASFSSRPLRCVRPGNNRGINHLPTTRDVAFGSEVPVDVVE
jgi:hypothetical protein